MKKSNKILLLALLISILWSCKHIKQKTINVGSVQVLTGQMSKYGKTLQAALTAYSEVANEKLLKAGKLPINIITKDTKLDPKTGVSDANQLIQVDNTPVIIGALGSSVTLAIAPVAEKNKVVLISPASGSPEISTAGDFIFRTCPSDIYEAEYIAKYYNENLTGKSIVILYINNDYGLGLKNGFINKLQSKPEKLLEISFDQGQSDFKNQLSKIKNENIEVVYVIGYEEMITIFKQAKEFDLNVAWLGNNQLNDQSMIDKMNGTANGVIFPGHEYEIEKVKEKYPVFYKKYLKYSNNQELDVFAAYGVDALMLIESAIMNDKTSGEAIRKYLNNLKSFKGITGTFEFNEFGDPIRHLKLYQIKNGKIVEMVLVH